MIETRQTNILHICYFYFGIDFTCELQSQESKGRYDKPTTWVNYDTFNCLAKADTLDDIEVRFQAQETLVTKIKKADTLADNNFTPKHIHYKQKNQCDTSSPLNLICIKFTQSHKYNIFKRTNEL